jgi:hypothetical protein
MKQSRMEGACAEHECVEAYVETLDNCYLSFSAPEYCVGTPFLVVSVARTGGGALSHMEVEALAAAW